MRQVSERLRSRMRSAAEVFATHGFDASTIEMISEATGVPSSTLYYNFAGKEEVLSFLMQDWLDRTSAAVDEAAATAGAARQRLEAVLGAQLTAMAEDPATCHVLLAELGRIDRLPHIAAAVGGAFHHPVAKLLADGAADGSLREVDIDTATSVLYGAVTMTGLRHVIASHGEVPAFDAEALAARVTDVVFGGVGAR